MVDRQISGGGPSGATATGTSQDRQKRKRNDRHSRLVVGVCVAILALMLAGFWPVRWASANHAPYCYVVGDDSSNHRVLSRVTKADFDPATNELTIGVLGTLKTDG